MRGGGGKRKCLLSPSPPPPPSNPFFLGSDEEEEKGLFAGEEEESAADVWHDGGGGGISPGRRSRKETKTYFRIWHLVLRSLMALLTPRKEGGIRCDAQDASKEKRRRRNVISGLFCSGVHVRQALNLVLFVPPSRQRKEKGKVGSPPSFLGRSPSQQPNDTR